MRRVLTNLGAGRGPAGDTAVTGLAEEQMTRDEIRPPALTGEPWPVIGVRVRREDHSPRAASWRPAPRAVLEDVLLLCTRPKTTRAS
ncbi:hypothetical protein [Streptomyces sp. NRRL S-37]|uniref:hypothetical protein n=1 Tax=Streptomyces sp. NRRL S-37 TaxID=1463903 RepID=UPI0004C598F5|nr:hypothetical protein [Streptomyces sp. NRRL S-37]